MITIRKRWRLQALMGLIALTALGLAYFRKLPDLGPVFKLKYADPQGRMSAAIELGRSDLKMGNSAEPALVAALSDPNQGVRDCAAWALDQLGSTDPALVKALVKQIRVLCGIDREAELQGIGVFIEMLGAETIEARRTALQSLATFGPKASSAIPALINLAEGTEAVPAGSDDANLALLIFETIHQVGNGDDPLLVEVLVRMLKSKGGVQRWGAVVALGHLSPPPKGVVPALVAAMKDEQPVARRGASYALGRYLGSERKTASKALLAAMNDPDLWVRITAGRSLASLGEAAAEAVRPIIRLLSTEDPNLRGQAAEILGKFGPSAKVASAALLVALDDVQDHVRKSAENALNAVSPELLDNPARTGLDFRFAARIGTQPMARVQIRNPARAPRLMLVGPRCFADPLRAHHRLPTSPDSATVSVPSSLLAKANPYGSLNHICQQRNGYEHHNHPPHRERSHHPCPHPWQ